MIGRPLARRSLGLLLVGVVLLLLLGQVLGQPVLVSYVETGSMAPTLSPGDGFVAIPAALAGDIGPGDVVTYRAERLHGGGLTTHRVVGVTERGYVTKGDANAFTDQESVEPVVRPPQIVATALTVRGRVVAIPHVGSLVVGVRGVLAGVQARVGDLLGLSASRGGVGLAAIVGSLGLALYVLGRLRTTRGAGHRDRGRSRSRPGPATGRMLVLGSAALLVAAATASMVVPGGVQQFGVVSADTDAPGPRVIQKGTAESATYPVRNGGLLPVYVVLEPHSQGIDVQPTELAIASRSQANATVTLSAPPTIGYYREFLGDYRYLAVLPRPVIHSLSSLHPWAPILVIDALLALGVLALGFGLLGRGPRRTRARNDGSVLPRRTPRQ